MRGDGVFETCHVRGGSPWLLDQHLARMAGSAERLDLDLPPAAELAELARQACERWPAETEGALKLVCTRGPEDDPGVTVFATLTEVGEGSRRLRREGVRVGTLDLGITAGARSGAPWLLGGAKTLSYAVNMACLRWAARAGLDDVLWVSADGYLLEAPTSTLVWLEGGTLYTVPAATGILAGITGRWLLDHAGTLGWHTAERMIRPAELESAAGVWLTSSVRGVVPVRQVDETKLADSPHTDTLRELLGFTA